MEAVRLQVTLEKGFAAGTTSYGWELRKSVLTEALHILNQSEPLGLCFRRQGRLASAFSAVPVGLSPVGVELKTNLNVHLKRPAPRMLQEQPIRASTRVAASKGGEEELAMEAGPSHTVSVESLREDERGSTGVSQLEPSLSNVRLNANAEGIPGIISSIDELISLQKEAASIGAVSSKDARPSDRASPPGETSSRGSTGTAEMPGNRQSTRPANKVWVRDATGTMRRADQKQPPSNAPGGAVKPPSPSRMKLPRHGPPRASAVMRLLYEARDLTTEGVLDQLADAVRRSELNMIIKDLGVRGRTNKAYEVFQWMLQQGDERRAPDEITFNSIINVLSKHEQVEKAQHVFDMIHMVGCRRNTFHYNALLSGYAKQGLASDALALFERMKAEGVEPDGSSYNILINACGRGKQLTRAIALFEEMVGKGFQATHITYTSLVGACGRDNRPFQALRIFQEATSGGIPPDRPMFNALLEALGRGSLYDEMADVRRQMAERSFTPSLEAFRSMLASYKQGERYTEARAVLDEMRKAGHDPGPVRLPL